MLNGTLLSSLTYVNVRLRNNVVCVKELDNRKKATIDYRLGEGGTNDSFGAALSHVFRPRKLSNRNKVFRIRNDSLFIFIIFVWFNWNVKETTWK